MSSNRGLEDVVAGTTALCLIDGRQGRLIYRGIDIHAMIGRSSFEETAYLLWFGSLPTRSQLNDLNKKFAAERRLPAEIQMLLKAIAKKASPMAALRTMVSALAIYDPDAEDPSRDANLRKAIRMTARFPSIIADYHRLRNNHDPIPSDASLGHAANFLYILTGRIPDRTVTGMFDACLILHADHEFNASTFAARVTAATLSDAYSAVTSAIGALKGPLHGGANEQVIKLLSAIGTPDRVEEYIQGMMSRKEKVPGFGHRVYKTEDPRATHLRKFSQELAQKTGDSKWYEMSRRVEEAMIASGMKARGICANVDFYSASTYHYLGIPTDLFTPVFALSRVVGWTAHVLEQYADNRLIRPMGEYTGPQEVPYVPIEQRG
ncbi:MAG: citrate synthase [Candidatus Latescibacteria bacterium]|nr:citrate synthase [Candidatus Latescibacterota bacterium]